MAHQFPANQPHVAQMPPQQQNMGQPRQGPMAQQQMPAMGQQQRGMQGQHPLHNAHVRYDPQFALFTFERQKGAEGWEDVEAEQQHVNVQDLQNDVKKFQRNKNTVSRVMEEIPSTNARRLINELVEEQNVDLMAKNRTLRWTIASINIKWTMIGRNKRQLKRISVILQTGPSGYEDPHAVRAAATGVGAKAQPMQPNPGLGHQVNHPAHDVSQQPRNPPPQPQMGHVQQPPQQMRPPPAHAQPAHGQAPPPPAHAQPARGQVPPPPPPPPGMGNPQPPPPVPGPFEHLPPPPPNGGHGMPRPAPHGQHQPRTMPGAFPEVMHRPAMRQGQPPIEVLDSNYLRKQKKSKGHHDESSSESDSDSDDWVSESGDSMPDRFRGHKVEHGEFVHIGKPEHGRPRQSSRSRKSRHNKSHSKGRSRSRSRSHVRTETYRRRRDSDYIDPPPMGKHSPMSSKDSSPHSSKQQLPPIHIHVNEKPTRANERVRRDSHTPSSPDYRKDKFGGEPLSRSSSWDRHSGTASFNDNSSIHTADDSVFSEPNRHHRKSYQSDIIDHSPKLRSRALPPRENYGQPHPSHIYGDVEPRPRRSAYPANDYPQVLRQREPYYDEHAFTPRPGVHRRNSAQIQTPGGNPFDTGRFPPQPRLSRASTYAPEMQEPMYAHHEPRYVSDRPTNDALRLDALQDEIEQLKERGRRPLHGRRASEYERMGSYGGYDRHERYGYGM